MEKYLVKVEPGANNNKYYKMVVNGSTLNVEYGRVGPVLNTGLILHINLAVSTTRKLEKDTKI